MSSPGLKPAFSIAFMTKSSAASARRQVGREAAFVADIGVVAGLLQTRFFSAWKTSAPMRTASAKRRRADRQDHEFLEVDRVVGMRAAIDDVHHRHRQDMRLDAADIAVERQAGGIRRRLGDGERHAEDGVGAEPAPCSACRRARSSSRRSRPGLRRRCRSMASKISPLTLSTALSTPLPQIARLVAVAQFDRLMGAGRGARGHGGAADRAVLEDDIDLDGRDCRGCRGFRGRRCR